MPDVKGFGTRHPEIFAALAEPFPPHLVKQKPGGGGRRLSYITARSAMNRLDAVLGPENWTDEYLETKDGIRCTITITLPDGRTLAKTDGAGFEDMSAEDDSEKSGYSNAFKRAAVKFGVGRELYQDGYVVFDGEWPARVAQPGSAPTPVAQGGARFAVGPPADGPRPANGNPSPRPPAQRTPPPPSRPSGDVDPRLGNLPRSGAALFAWAKGLSERNPDLDCNFIKVIDGFAQANDLPKMYREWPPAAIEDAVKAVVEVFKRADSEAGGRPAGHAPAAVVADANGDDIPF